MGVWAQGSPLNELKSLDGGEEFFGFKCTLIPQKYIFLLLINMRHTFHEIKTLITYFDCFIFHISMQFILIFKSSHWHIVKTSLILFYFNSFWI